MLPRIGLRNILENIDNIRPIIRAGGSDPYALKTMHLQLSEIHDDTAQHLYTGLPTVSIIDSMSCFYATVSDMIVDTYTMAFGS